MIINEDKVPDFAKFSEQLKHNVFVQVKCPDTIGDFQLNNQFYDPIPRDYTVIVAAVVASVVAFVIIVLVAVSLCKKS